MTIYEYTNPEHDGEDAYPDAALSFKTNWDEDYPEWIAEDAAKKCFSEDDGWDFDWPVLFEIFSDGKSIGKFLVSLETEPVFSATII